MAKRNKKRSDGRVKVSVYLGIDENGKEKRRYFYGSTAKEAEEKANDFRAKIGRGIDVDTNRDTFRTWSSRWLKSKKGTVGEKTYSCYMSFADYLNNGIGDMIMDKIRPYDIQNVLSELAAQNPHTRKPSSKKLISDVQSTARKIFDYAIGNRAVEFNPALYVAQPKTPPKETRRALSEEEREWIASTEHRMQVPAMIMLYTGLRRGELLPLVKSDFDLDNGVLAVSKFVEMVNGKPSLKRYGKTDAAKREVYFPSILSDFLRPVLDGLGPFDLVCPMNKRSIYTDSGWKSAWKSYMSVLNFEHGKFQDRPKSRFDPKGVPMVIQPFTAHCLRHTFATLMYEAGVDVLTAKEQLGHADIKTTLGIYTHLEAEHRDKSMSKLNDFLSCRGQIGVNQS